MRHIYSVYALFLIVVALRYAWRAWHALRYGVETEPHHYESRTDE
jgi:C4-dicarboxylate transporter DctQ subunit